MIRSKVLAFLFSLSLAAAQAQSIPFPGPGGGAAAPLSLGNGVANASGSTQAFATSGNIIGGDSVFVYVFTQQAGPTTVSSMSDGTNTYTKANSNTQATSVTGELWYKLNATAVTSPTITATMSGAATANATFMAVAQAAGITVFDKTAIAGNSAAGQTTLSSGNTAALSQANELVIGAVGVNTTVAITESAGYTNINNFSSGTNSSRLAYKFVASTTAVSYAPSTPSTTETWVSVVGTFH